MNLFKKLNQAGQVSVEYVLIAAVLVAIAFSVKGAIQNSKMLAQFVQGPWDMVSGLIENGVWGGAEKSRALHPGHLSRHRSLKGET